MGRTNFSRKNGKVYVNGKTYDKLEGTRAMVWHKTAYKTSGDLRRDDLLQNKHGRIVSKKLHNRAKREKRLEKAGYKTKKGHFGAFYKGEMVDKRHRSRGRRDDKRRRDRKRYSYKGGYHMAALDPAYYDGRGQPGPGANMQLVATNY